MTINGKVIDATTAQPLPNASVELLDYYGISLGIGTIADSTGNFVLTSDEIGYPNSLNVSYVGYKPVAYDLSNATGTYFLVKLQSQATAAPGITVTAVKKNLGWLALIAAFLVIGSKK